MKGKSTLVVILVSGLFHVFAQQPPAEQNNQQQQPPMDPNNPGEYPEPGEAPVAQNPESAANQNPEGAPPSNPNNAGGEAGQNNPVPANYHDPSNPGEIPEPGEARVPQTNANTGQGGGSNGGTNNEFGSTGNAGGANGQTGNTAGQPPFHDPTNPGEYGEIPEPGEGPVGGQNQTNTPGLNNPHGMNPFGGPDPNGPNQFGGSNQNNPGTGGTNNALLNALQLQNGNTNLNQANNQGGQQTSTGTGGKFSAFFKALQGPSQSANNAANKQTTGSNKQNSATSGNKNGGNINQGQGNSGIQKAQIKNVASEMARILLQELRQQGNNYLPYPGYTSGPSQYNGNNGNPSPLTANIPPIHRKFSYMLDVLTEMKAAARNAARKTGFSNNNNNLGPQMNLPGPSMDNNLPGTNLKKPFLDGSLKNNQNTTTVPEWMKRIHGLQMNPSLMAVQKQSNSLSFGNNNNKPQPTNPPPKANSNNKVLPTQLISMSSQLQNFGNKATTFSDFKQLQNKSPSQMPNVPFPNFQNAKTFFAKFAAMQQQNKSPIPPQNAGPVPPSNAGPVAPPNIGNFQNANNMFTKFEAYQQNRKPQPPPTAGPMPPPKAVPMPPPNFQKVKTVFAKFAAMQQQNRNPVPQPNYVPLPPPNTGPLPPTNAGPVPPPNAPNFQKATNFFAKFATMQQQGRRQMPPPNAVPLPPQNTRPTPPPNSKPLSKINIPVPPPNNIPLPPPNTASSVGPRPQPFQNIRKPFFPNFPKTNNNAQFPFKAAEFMFNKLKSSNMNVKFPPSFNNYPKPPGANPSIAPILPMTMNKPTSKPAVTTQKPSDLNSMFQIYGPNANANSGLQGLKTLIAKMAPPGAPLGPK